MTVVNIRYPDESSECVVVLSRRDAEALLSERGECLWSPHLFEPNVWGVRVTNADGRSVALAEVRDDGSA